MRSGPSEFTQAAKWWQGLGMQTNSRCSPGTMKMFGHLKRAMCAQAREQALIIGALPECHGGYAVGPLPAPGRPGLVAGKAWAGSFSGS